MAGPLTIRLRPPFGAVCAEYVCAVEDVVEPDIGDDVLLSYRWELNGAPLEIQGDTASGSWLEPGDVLQCFVTPSDGALDASFEPILGEEVASSLAEVYNAKPTVEAVTLLPAEPAI